MPSSLTFHEHLLTIERSGERLIGLAVAAGLDTAVPTCPAWDALALVAHQAMVHRWAAATIRGEDPDALETQTKLRELGNGVVTVAHEALASLLDALRAAPADLRAMTFLNDAPAPREFWARRQAHETTIHMVDALGASLGRVPTAAEVGAQGVGRPLALDGVDELLRGFFTRGRSKLWLGTDHVLVVEPDDADRRWVVRVGEHLSVDEGNGAAVAADLTLRGPALALYLGLWNRGDEIVASGQHDLLERWRKVQRVRWS